MHTGTEDFTVLKARGTFPTPRTKGGYAVNGEGWVVFACRRSSYSSKLMCTSMLPSSINLGAAIINYETIEWMMWWQLLQGDVRVGRGRRNGALQQTTPVGLYCMLWGTRWVFEVCLFCGDLFLCGNLVSNGFFFPHTHHTTFSRITLTQTSKITHFLLKYLSIGCLQQEKKFFYWNYVVYL